MTREKTLPERLHRIGKKMTDTSLIVKQLSLGPHVIQRGTEWSWRVPTGSPHVFVGWSLYTDHSGSNTSIRPSQSKRTTRLNSLWLCSAGTHPSVFQGKPGTGRLRLYIRLFPLFYNRCPTPLPLSASFPRWYVSLWLRTFPLSLWVSSTCRVVRSRTDWEQVVGRGCRNLIIVKERSSNYMISRT